MVFLMVMNPLTLSSLLGLKVITSHIKIIELKGEKEVKNIRTS